MPFPPLTEEDLREGTLSPYGACPGRTSVNYLLFPAGQFLRKAQVWYNKIVLFYLSLNYHARYRFSAGGIKEKERLL